MIFITNCGGPVTTTDVIVEKYYQINCTVEQVSNGALISCPDGSQVVVLNGVDGAQGEQGVQGEQGLQGPKGEDATPTEFSVVEVIDPCGDAPNVYDEILLKLANGQILALFVDNANGKNPRFSFITKGDYITTDGSNCRFSVTSDNRVAW